MYEHHVSRRVIATSKSGYARLIEYKLFSSRAGYLNGLCDDAPLLQFDQQFDQPYLLRSVYGACNVIKTAEMSSQYLYHFSLYLVLNVDRTFAPNFSTSQKTHPVTSRSADVPKPLLCLDSLSGLEFSRGPLLRFRTSGLLCYEYGRKDYVRRTELYLVTSSLITMRITMT